MRIGRILSGNIAITTLMIMDMMMTFRESNITKRKWTRSLNASICAKRMPIVLGTHSKVQRTLASCSALVQASVKNVHPVSVEKRTVPLQTVATNSSLRLICLDKLRCRFHQTSGHSWAKL